jgi:hypothetical protein
VKFKFNKPILNIMRDCGVNDDALRFAVGEARSLMNEFVPMDTGKLAGSVEERIDGSGKGSVVYTVPYARFCYYGEGLNFKRDKNPRAGAFWDRSMLQFYQGEFYARVRRFIKRN